MDTEAINSADSFLGWVTAVETATAQVENRGSVFSKVASQAQKEGFLNCLQHVRKEFTRRQIMDTLFRPDEFRYEIVAGHPHQTDALFGEVLYTGDRERGYLCLSGLFGEELRNLTDVTEGVPPHNYRLWINEKEGLWILFRRVGSNLMPAALLQHLQGIVNRTLHT